MPNVESYVPRSGSLIIQVLDRIQQEGRFDLNGTGRIPYLRLYKLLDSQGLVLQYGYIDKALLPSEGASFIRDNVFKSCGELEHQDYIGNGGTALVRCLESCLQKEIEHLGEYSQNDRRINPNNLVFVAGLKFVKIPKN